MKFIFVLSLCVVRVSCFGSVGFCFVSRVSGFKARGFRAPGGLPPRLRQTSTWSPWTYAGPCCYCCGPCCFLLYARDGWGCAAAHADSGCRPSSWDYCSGTLLVLGSLAGLGTDKRWSFPHRIHYCWRAAGWVDLATMLFKADVYRYGAGGRAVLGSSGS